MHANTEPYVMTAGHDTASTTEHQQYFTEWRAYQPKPVASRMTRLSQQQPAWSWQLSKTAYLEGPRTKAPSLDQWRAAVVTVRQAGQAALRLLQNLPQDTGTLRANPTPL